MTVDIRQGDSLALLRQMPDESVQMCVTSPPFFGLRDYGCEGQIGLEKTPELFVAKMVDVFREVRRVLKSDGVLWLNLGDSYAGSGPSGASYQSETTKARAGKSRDGAFSISSTLGARGLTYAEKKPIPPHGLKPKDLIGVPWMVAFALRTNGWWLRQDIIWHKPAPMPESVLDRCTKAHEYVFLMSKAERYYFDAKAISEPAVARNLHDATGISDRWHESGPGQTPHQGSRSGNKARKPASARGVPVDTDGQSNGAVAGSIPWEGTTRNKRSVWTINTKPFPEAHFATFPEELPTICVLAGSRAAGKRCDCDEIILTPTGTGDSDDPSLTTGRAGMNRPRRDDGGTAPISRREQRWHAREMSTSPNRPEMEAHCGKAFAHYIRTDKSGARPLPPRTRARWLADGWISEPPLCTCPVEPADTVLDPFSGAGTVGVVCARLGREFIGLELNPAYVEMSRRRILGPLFAQPEAEA